ncbi:MAG TPA: choice-of-anchor Q domain-containing protein [Kofleriaceae bacterium]
MARYLGIVIVLAFGLALCGLGCTKPNPVVCCTGAEDCSSLGVNEPNRPCQDGFVCVNHECELSTGPCLIDDECAQPTPYCDPGLACVGCLDATNCPAERPTCDEQTRSCRACVDDGDCASSVCDISTGMCVVENQVLYASPAGAAAGTCEKTVPCSITHAAALADASRHNVKLVPGAYTASVSVVGKRVVFYGVGATVAGPDDTAFTVLSGGSLRLVGLAVDVQTAGSSAAIRCADDSSGVPSLELFRATVDASNTTVIAVPCTVTIEQSVLRSRRMTSNTLDVYSDLSTAIVDRTYLDGGAGVSSLGSTIRIANSVLRRVGQGQTGGAIRGAGFDVSFSTFVDTVVVCGTGGTSGLILNSSIVYNSATGAPADTVQGFPNAACTLNHVVAYPQGQPLGATNIAGMLPRLKDVTNGDFHLESNSPAIDRGDPTSTLSVDFEGTARPQGGGRDSGAFEYKP